MLAKRLSSVVHHSHCDTPTNKLRLWRTSAPAAVKGTEAHCRVWGPGRFLRHQRMRQRNRVDNELEVEVDGEVFSMVSTRTKSLVFQAKAVIVKRIQQH